jgi:cytochrome b subunit of formate dehydrogenase
MRDPIALRGMTRGDVTPYWARTERPAWYREVVGDAPRSTAATRR